MIADLTVEGTASTVSIWLLFFVLPLVFIVGVSMALHWAGVKGPARGSWQHRLLQVYAVVMMCFLVWIRVHYN
jgi:hypothetical protein